MNSNTKALPPVTHAEAREILGRFNNSHFRSCKTGETARRCSRGRTTSLALMASPTPPRCTPGSSASMACRSPAH